MASPRELAHGREQLRKLIDYALREGWSVRRTPKGHLKFTRPGHASIYTGTTASDYRSCLNARAELRRAMRQAQQNGSQQDGKAGHG